MDTRVSGAARLRDADAEERDRRWVARAASALTRGEGHTLLRQGVQRADALALRRRLLRAIPEEKHTTRVFANHLCQVHEGVPESAGNDPSCEPLDPSLLLLALVPEVLALARKLFGDGFRLHNAGLSLVTPPVASADLAAHLPHQDLPINRATVWGGRVPPPSHPLSLQVSPPSMAFTASQSL